MKTLFFFSLRILIALLLVIVISLTGLLLLSLSQTPIVSSQMLPTPSDIRQVKSFVWKHNPKSANLNQPLIAVITPELAHKALHYGLMTIPSIQAQTSFTKEGIKLESSINLNKIHLPFYLNIGATVDFAAQSIELVSLHTNQLSIPGWPFNLLVHAGYKLSRIVLADTFKVIENLVKGFDYNEQALTVHYVGNPLFVSDLRQSIQAWITIDEAELEASTHYHHFLMAILKHQANLGNSTLSLSSLLKASAAEIDKRVRSGYSSDQELTSFFAILTLSVHGKTANKLISQLDNQAWPDVTITLLNRYDLALHFTLSAGLALSSHQAFSMMLGLFKEMDDAMPGGSGFSFADLAADRAGIMFANSIEHSEKSRAHLISTLLNMQKISVFMPSIKDLPEGINEKTFMEDFGGLRGEKYQQLTKEMDALLAKCEAYDY